MLKMSFTEEGCNENGEELHLYIIAVANGDVAIYFNDGTSLEEALKSVLEENEIQEGDFVKAYGIEFKKMFNEYGALLKIDNLLENTEK